MDRSIQKLLSKKLTKTPIWFMRQAGRYMKEYLEVRSNLESFLDLCYNPDKASEVTMQPIDKFDFDMSIIFSDILVIPHALGQKVEFIKNKGPVLNVSENNNHIDLLQFNEEALYPVYKAIKLTRAKLPKEKSLIGFSGAPWTLSTYMIEGGTTKDFAKVKSFMYADEQKFDYLIDILVDTTSKHLINQIEAGCDSVKIFDSWASVLNEKQFYKYSILPTKKIVQNIRSKYPDTPIIGFPKGAGISYPQYAKETGIDILAFDQNISPKWIKDNTKIALQGNLDPVLLASNVDKAIAYSKDLINLMQDRAFIFNLGHGILPITPVDNVEKIVNFVKEYQVK